MKLIVAISILTLIRAEDNQIVYIINGVRHYKEILFENLSSYFTYSYTNLAVDYKTNNLYGVEYTKREAAVLNLNTKGHIPITGVSNPTIVTVDQVNHDVFIGTYNGIYKYNVATGEVELVGARDEHVWRIYHYNGAVYYKNIHMHGEIRKLVNGQSIRYHEFGFDIWNFVIDCEENIFCQTFSGRLYRYQDATKHTFLYEGIPAVRSLTTDTFGNVYFSVDDGIYKIKGDSVERVVNITNPGYIAFDSLNNLIYYNDHEYKLYRLKPITYSCSDRYRSHFQGLEVTNNNDIKSELQIMNNKLDNLTQVMNMLLTNISLPQALIGKFRFVGNK